MRLRADFSKPELVHFDTEAFLGSPSGGVARFMLDRIGEEVARATSIVRFEPGAEFSPHTHNGGEEFLVLDGVFSDAYGDFPAGSYVRNPIGSHHRPGSKGGCTIFVKLWQMGAGEQQATRLDAGQVETRQVETERAASEALYEDAHERVSVVTLAPGEALRQDWPHGGEVLVLEGRATAEAQGQSYVLEPWSWLRLPACADAQAALELRAETGLRVWLKSLKTDRSYEAWEQRDTA